MLSKKIISKKSSLLNKKYLIFIVTLTAITIIASCTNTKAIIAEKDVEIAKKNAVISENNTLIDQLYRSIESCDEELEKTREQCSKQLNLIEEQDQKLLAREKQLRAQLAKDIELKNIEIEKLRGRLTVKVMDRILFRSGSVMILPEGEEVLTRVASSLAYSDESLRVEGHTDDVPIGSILVKSIPTNWELSVLRAASVVRFLENNEIEPERMTAAGNSEYKPLVENTTDENKQQNRRVEIILVPQ